MNDLDLSSSYEFYLLKYIDLLEIEILKSVNADDTDRLISIRNDYISQLNEFYESKKRSLYDEKW